MRAAYLAAIFFHEKNDCEGRSLFSSRHFYVQNSLIPVVLKCTFAFFRIADIDSAIDSKILGTPLTMMQDVGSGGYASGQRAHPLTWTSQDSTYINERPIGTQQTGYVNDISCRSRNCVICAAPFLQMVSSVSNPSR